MYTVLVIVHIMKLWVEPIIFVNVYNEASLLFILGSLINHHGFKRIYYIYYLP